MTKPFAEHLAIVTGAGRGIGFGIAEAFGREGASVVVGELDAQRGAEAAATLKAQGCDALAIPLDVTQSASCRALVDRVVAAYGRIASGGRRWMEDAALYDRTCRAALPGARTCRAQHVRLRARAAALAEQIDAAEDLGRRGWIEPGEIREIAHRQGLDDALSPQVALVIGEGEGPADVRGARISGRRPRRQATSTPRR